MYQVSNQKFGEFLSEMRKENNMTQKELAERLFVSDKTVSKWECGKSFPNVTLLIPIAEVLGISVDELLSAERVQPGETLQAESQKKILSHAVKQNKKYWKIAFAAALCILFAETILFFFSRAAIASVRSTFIFSFMMMFFSGWFCLFAKDLLPAYYDENKINYVSQGIFRIHLVGLSFHNGNWPYLLNMFRIFTLAAAVALPAICYAVIFINGVALWDRIQDGVLIICVLILILMTYLIGKKYE